jgi:hypothetical protein
MTVGYIVAVGLLISQCSVCLAVLFFLLLFYYSYVHIRLGLFLPHVLPS